jgi:DNA helicase-2/ATP-dependent DNA helicase PcrA
VNKEWEFTQGQRALIDAEASMFIDACPGAGKTQAIVQRFLDRPAPDPRRGVALLSFTNAAVDEARSRCATAPQLMRAPNFVGTIDGFLNRYLVTPVFTARNKVHPTFFDTWATVPGSSITVQGIAFKAPLTAFAFNAQFEATLMPILLRADQRRAVEGLEPWQVDQLEHAAALRWRSYVSRGMLDATAARMCLTHYLKNHEMRNKLKDLMRHRFYEVIVDEVQDCSREDLLVFELLGEAGVRLVLLGDREQAIYGFRADSHSQADLEPLLAPIETGQRLDGNFRSSPAICRIVDSLRHGDQKDQPLGSNKDVTDPILVLPYSRTTDVATELNKVIDGRSLERSDVVVLAHSQSTARACAGGSPEPKPTESKLLQLAAAVSLLQGSNTPPLRKVQALRDVVRIIRELGSGESLEKTEVEFLEARGITRRQMDEMCLRLAMTLSPPYQRPPSDFKAELVAFTSLQKRLGWGTRGLRIPNGDSWSSILKPSADAYEYSTIHGYKGLQAAVVVLVLPQTSSSVTAGTTLWDNGLAGEARRVLYVGASRAERLLILATHTSVQPVVEGILQREQIPWGRV